MRKVGLGMTEQYVRRKFLDNCLEANCRGKILDYQGSNHAALARLVIGIGRCLNDKL